MSVADSLSEVCGETSMRFERIGYDARELDAVKGAGFDDVDHRQGL
jgi:hypothetical protein